MSKDAVGKAWPLSREGGGADPGETDADAMVPLNEVGTSSAACGVRELGGGGIWYLVGGGRRLCDLEGSPDEEREMGKLEPCFEQRTQSSKAIT